MSSLPPSLWKVARYVLKYCLEEPFNPKQPTNLTPTALTATWLQKILIFYHYYFFFLIFYTTFSFSFFVLHFRMPVAIPHLQVTCLKLCLVQFADTTIGFFLRHKVNKGIPKNIKVSQYFILRFTGTPLRFPAIFGKGNNFCNFLSASLADKPFHSGVYS